MNTFIDEILNELYEIDPGYKTYEVQLIKALNLMLKNKPDTKFNLQFKAELRSKLLQKIEELKQRKSVSLFGSQYLWRVLALTSTTAVLLIVLVYNLDIISSLKPNNVALKYANEQINVLPDQAFGSLGLELGSASALDRGLATSSTVSMGLGGGGRDVKMVAPPSAGYAEPGIILPQDIYVPKIVYSGEKIEINADNVDIYKKVETKSSAVLNPSKITLPGMDLSKFKGLVLNNITIDENIDLGYTITFGSLDNAISINQNWLKWPAAQTQAYQPIKENELLSAEETISIVNKFMEQYKIDLKNYGKPALDNGWKIYYEAAPNKADYPMPEWQTVRYPLIFNGKNVYDDGGRTVGVDVSVDARQKRVSSLYGLSTPKYQSSAYVVEKDTQKILDVATRGGVYYYGPIYQDGSIGVIDFKVELGTPAVEFMRYFRYLNNTTEELIVPALIFPVVNNPRKDIYPNEKVVVPIVKDLLESITNPSYPIDNGRPVPAPFIK